MTLKNTAGALALAGALCATTAACGLLDASGAAPVSYAPAAYYQTVGGVYECYYVSSPQEAYALENAGLCPTYAIPTLMPVSWEEEYFDYYSSSAYYGTYVPASYRRTYVNITCVHFHQTYSSQITRLSKTAVYRSSTGGTVRGVQKTSSFSSSSSGRTTYSVPVKTYKSSTITRNYGRH